MRVTRRAQVLAFGGLILVFAVALVLLRPVAAPLSDAEYVAIAKDTPQGQLYFKNHSAPCRVARVWNVQVNCDYTAAPGIPAVALVQRYGENDATFPGNYTFHTVNDTAANVSNRRLWLKAAKLTLATALDLAATN